MYTIEYVLVPKNKSTTQLFGFENSSIRQLIHLCGFWQGFTRLLSPDTWRSFFYHSWAHDVIHKIYFINMSPSLLLHNNIVITHTYNLFNCNNHSISKTTCYICFNPIDIIQYYSVRVMHLMKKISWIVYYKKITCNLPMHMFCSMTSWLQSTCYR